MQKQQQKNEAIERMKMLKLYPNIIKEFKKENIINMSENGGMLYWLKDDERQIVEDFETEYNTVVYHVIHNYTELGEMYALLYVSDDEEEWEYDRDDLLAGYPLAYVKNVTDNNCSEFGSIGVKMRFGGLIRTA